MWSHVGHKVGSRTGVTSCSIFCLLICFVWTFSQAFDESSDAENQRPVKPAMEGHLQIGTKLWHYLGGFCFGHKSPYEQSHAGSINLQLRYDGEPEGMVHVLFYDDEPSQWEAVQAVRNSSHCDSLINASSKAHRFQARKRENYTLFIDQHVTSRHWHIVLAACVPKLVNAVDYQIFAQGNLAQWGSGTKSPTQCPHEPLQKVKDVVLQLEAIMM